MPLSDEQIDKQWRGVDYTIPYKQFRIDVASAIESAATAPLLAQIAALEAHSKEMEQLAARGAASLVKASQDMAQLEAQLLEARKDAERLDWMIFHSAKVCHSNDAEYCSVKWVDDYEQCQTDVYGNAREAIDAAISQGQPNARPTARP